MIDGSTELSIGRPDRIEAFTCSNRQLDEIHMSSCMELLTPVQ